MRISDWSSDVCSSDLEVTQGFGRTHHSDQVQPPVLTIVSCDLPADKLYASRIVSALFKLGALTQGHRHAASNGMFDERDCLDGPYALGAWEDLQAEIADGAIRSEEHTSELQSLIRISYAVFCLKKKK